MAQGQREGRERARASGRWRDSRRRSTGEVRPARANEGDGLVRTWRERTECVPAGGTHQVRGGEGAMREGGEREAGREMVRTKVGRVLGRTRRVLKRVTLTYGEDQGQPVVFGDG